MTEERTTPLRQRMIEDMRIRGMGEKAQQAHIRAIKDFAAFLGPSPDAATREELRAYQLHMTDTGVTPSTFNVRIVALRFFFGMTCGREDMKRFMQFRTEPRKLPVVFSVEEVSDILMAAPGPGLKYRAALSISYGAGLRAAEVCNLKIGDIDSDRMLIHVEQGKPIKYDKRRYKRRNRIEIMFGRLKDWRRVASRYDRSPKVFLSAIALAATVMFCLVASRRAEVNLVGEMLKSQLRVVPMQYVEPKAKHQMLIEEKRLLDDSEPCIDLLNLCDRSGSMRCARRLLAVIRLSRRRL
ncbi:tyrosine-type recombinase/integrase [Paenirhodobacter populi]|uniref:tyrosine-type recombinase/integrase n=1 Tax=Paenirhodobacter populi TaxID=2306993 RepID=UPI0026987A2A